MVLAAVAQICSTPSVSQNIRTALTVIKRASAIGAKMVFLPEASDFIAPASQVASLSKPLDSGQNEYLEKIMTAAKESKLWINLGIHESPHGSISSEGEQRCFNTNLVISDLGKIVGTYRKMNLFDVDLSPNGPTIKESDTTIRGATLESPIPDTPVGNLGLQTCYDIRFSTGSQLLTSDARYPATALTFPSAFAVHTGAAHWEVLLRARAIENQCYVFGSAQVGEHFPGRRSYGYAMIVDPWGTVVAQCPQTTSEPQICVADIDLEVVRKVRREMPMGRI